MTPSEAVGVLAGRYGIDATVCEVACERDQNFHVVASDRREYVLKISNPEEPRITTDFQTQGILWIERADPGIPVPKLVPTREGHYQTVVTLADGRQSMVRVLTWLQGTPLYKVAINPAIEEAIGTVLARIGRALRDFTHEGARQDLLWDIRHASRLKPLLYALPTDALGIAVRDELERFEVKTRPKLEALRHQVVHNDLNHHNLMVDPGETARITGVIDFGDMVETCLAVDVAVAASYLADHPEDALGSVARMIAAYHRVTPLQRAEIEVMRDLIVARLVTSITITEWRARRYPENATYILRNNGPAKLAMSRFAALDRNHVTGRLLRACEME
ncbi:phosphotransferase [Antarcticimicrobium luteum]|nr:phosphotransferase [Antarcticimicrobium luteum]